MVGITGTGHVIAATFFLREAVFFFFARVTDFLTLALLIFGNPILDSTMRVFSFCFCVVLAIPPKKNN